ncbi:hypothetical protein F3K40_31785 [Streptomyces sp. LBUM 1478]|nr:hypothetical protein [Streptomyces sp. LBUM 1478]
MTALEDGLTGQLRAHRPDLVPALVRHLNAALATRTEGRRESLTGLVHAGGNPWQEEAERRESDGAATTTALQLLIQQALITPPAGDKPTDLIALAELTALAELLLRTALVAIPASRGLHPATLTVHPSGVFTLDGATTTSGADSPEHLGLDIAAYRNAQEQAWFARARQSHPQPLAPRNCSPPAAAGALRSPSPPEPTTGQHPGSGRPRPHRLLGLRPRRARRRTRHRSRLAHPPGRNRLHQPPGPRPRGRNLVPAARNPDPGRRRPAGPRPGQRGRLPRPRLCRGRAPHPPHHPPTDRPRRRHHHRALARTYLPAAVRRRSR